MKIYIASSWKNQHAVEMLTLMLRDRNHEVLSFIENNQANGHGDGKPIPFEEWVDTQSAAKCFSYDIDGATKSDLVIYVGPSGTDAWAEVGAAWASGIMVIGLKAKGEPSGLMRKMVAWFESFRSILVFVDIFAINPKAEVN